MAETVRTIKVLLSGLVDYAGLFPPASLDMQGTVERFARYNIGNEAWALGRIIVPASRLAELSDLGAALMPGTAATSGYTEMTAAGEPWRVSAIIKPDESGSIGPSLDLIDAFNERHAEADHGRARVDAVEMLAETPNAIDDALDELPEDLMPAFEIPPAVVTDGDPRGFAAALAGNDAAGKIRCGGVKPEMIPPTEGVARCVAAFAIAQVPFKGTAGLHHPVRAEHPLSYASDAPRGVMHGFMNLFIGAALLHARQIDEAGVVSVLQLRDPAAFEFTDDAVRVRTGDGEHMLDVMALSAARERFCLSYGSCSFEEPLDDLRGLSLMV